MIDFIKNGIQSINNLRFLMMLLLFKSLYELSIYHKFIKTYTNNTYTVYILSKKE